MQLVQWFDPQFVAPSRVVSLVRWLFLGVCLSVAYIGLGAASLGLAVPPGYSAPIYPSAGIALGAAALYGPTILPFIAIGQLAVKFYNPMPGLWDNLTVPLIIALAAAAQAAIGSLILAKLVRWPTPLQQAKHVLLFCLVIAPISSASGSALSVANLALHGLLPTNGALMVWLVWWLGDTVGVVCVTPMVFAAFAKPRAVWAPRLLTYAAPMALCIVLVAAASHIRTGLDIERIHSNFEQRSTNIQSALAESIRDKKITLNTTTLALAMENQASGLFEGLAKEWMAQEPSVNAIGWAEFQGDENRLIAVVDGPYSNVDWSELLKRREVADTLKASQATLTGAASNSLRWATDEAIPSVIVVRFVKTSQDKKSQFAFVYLQPDQMLNASAKRQLNDLAYCLKDVTREPSRGALLSFNKDCNGDKQRPLALPVHLLKTIQFPFFDRIWQLDLLPGDGFVADQVRYGPVFAAIGGMAGLVCLSILFLILTGQNGLIQQKVMERTTALREQLAQRAADAKALQLSQANLQHTINALPVGVSFVSVQGFAVNPNPKACSLLGLSAKQIEARNIWEFFNEQGVKKLKETFRQLRLQPHLAHRVEVSIRRADNTMLDIESHMSVVRMGLDEPEMIMAVFFDITTRLQLRAAFQAKELAEQTSRSKSQFIASISHELRTPLNALLGFSQLMRADQENTLPQVQAQRLGYVEESGWHLLAMIDDVLELSRIEAGGLKVAIEQVELIGLINSCCALLGNEVNKHKLRLTVQLLAAPVYVMVDEKRLRQVLLNILSNAIKYNRPGGAIVVAAVQDAAQVRVSVSDTGQGIPKELLPHLFEPFNRLGQEKGMVGGTGIGMVICKHLMHAMQGTIVVNSEAGQGTVVMLGLVPGSANKLVDLDNRQQNRQHDQQHNAAHHQHKQRLEQTS
jgi:PAS domain S-box-containing protein